MNSLMAEVIEDHIREHAFRRAKPRSQQSEAADDFVDVMRSYLKDSPDRRLR
jgi:DNA-binding FrmR family transcriptional regulator